MSTIKRKLFVLEKYSNGHIAALRFMRREKWKKAETEIVFCESHDEILNKLSKGHGFAVLPTYNKFTGHIGKYTDEVERLKQCGHVIESIGSVKIRVKQCLIVQKEAHRFQNITEVYSHEQGLAQCSEFLRNNGFKRQQQIFALSTVAAVRHVAENKVGVIAAIASELAAKAYKCKVLLRDIENGRNNYTLFNVVENRTVFKATTVGIIGIEGGFGKLCAAFFRKLDYNVIGSDIKGDHLFTNEQVVTYANVVVFALDGPAMRSVAQSVAHLSHEDQLFIDVMSTKVGPVLAMLKSKAQVVGLHPMFAPSAPMKGQTIVVCYARLTDMWWIEFVRKMLAETEATIIESTPEYHDQMMVPVQGIPQLGTLINALLFYEMDVSMDECRKFASPFYQLLLMQTCRLISQDPKLYAWILMENDDMLHMLKERQRVTNDIIKIIEEKDTVRFTEWFVKAREHFGQSTLDEANAVFKQLISVIKAPTASTVKSP